MLSDAALQPPDGTRGVEQGTATSHPATEEGEERGKPDASIQIKGLQSTPR